MKIIIDTDKKTIKEGKLEYELTDQEVSKVLECLMTALARKINSFALGKHKGDKKADY